MRNDDQESPDFGDVETYYSSYYSKMMGEDASGLMKALAKYPHRLMEKPFKKGDLRVLEVGAGGGEHFRAAKILCTEYTALDVDKERLEKIVDVNVPQLIKIVGDASNLPMADNLYDRLIATCLLAHLNDPEKALLEWRRVVRSGGYLSIYLPCEPGIALRIFRLLISGRKAKKLGYKGFPLYIARDHRNSTHQMLILIRHIFRNDQIRTQYRPIFVKSWNLNFFIIVQIKRLN